MIVGMQGLAFGTVLGWTIAQHLIAPSHGSGRHIGVGKTHHDQSCEVGSFQSLCTTKFMFTCVEDLLV